MRTRCRNFDDDKKPIGQGCRKGVECTWVHPDSPDWERAIRRGNNSYGAGNRQSGSSGRNDSGRRTSDSWGAPNRASVTASNTTPLPDAGSRWGNTNAQASGSSGSEPHALVDEPDRIVKPVAWAPPTWESSNSASASADASGGWGSTGNSGWETSGDSGWGSSGGGGWGNTSDSTSSWGATNNNNDNKDSADKAKQAADITMRDPSPPPRMHIPLPPPRNGRRDSQATKPDPPLGTEPKSSRSQSPSHSSNSTSTLSTAKSTVPVPLPKKPRVSLPATGNLKKMALELSANKAAQETGNIYIRDTSGTQSPAPPDLKKYTGPKGRVALFEDNLKCLLELVVSHVLLERSQHDVDRWKRTQNSEIYAHATPLTREFLDFHRGEYNKQVLDARKCQGKALKALISLPEFAGKNKAINPRVTKEVVARYTLELRAWLSDLQIHRRLLVERDGEEAKLNEASPDPMAMDTQPPQPTAQQLLERGNWSWKELQGATNILEIRVASTAEQVYSEVYTRYGDLTDQIQANADPVQVEEAVVDDSQESANNLLRGINRVGDELGAQAVRAAELFKRLDGLQAELDLVVAEKNKMNEIYAQAEKQFEEFELSKQAHANEIRELTEKLQKLHQHKRPKQLLPSQASPPPVKIDDILEYIRPFLLKRMETDLSPMFDALRNRCLENQEDVAKELQNMVKPTTDLTDVICQKVASMTLAQASAQIQA